jgi:hypothetical protein
MTRAIWMQFIARPAGRALRDKFRLETTGLASSATSSKSTTPSNNPEVRMKSLFPITALEQKRPI